MDSLQARSLQRHAAPIYPQLDVGTSRVRTGTVRTLLVPAGATSLALAPAPAPAIAPGLDKTTRSLIRWFVVAGDSEGVLPAS